MIGIHPTLAVPLCSFVSSVVNGFGFGFAFGFPKDFAFAFPLCSFVSSVVKGFG